MIDRRRVAVAIAGSTLAALFVTIAQSKDKVWKLGYIGVAPAGTSPESERLVQVLVRALREYGFVEGKNVVLERRATEGRAEGVPALVSDLVHLPVDALVVVDSGVALHTAVEATKTIPIVMLNASDPVASGIVKSLARPGGNITGLTDFNEDLYPKRLELLMLAAPKIGRVAFVQGDYGPSFDAATADALRQKQDAASRALGINLLRISMDAPSDFERVTATIIQGRADALLLGPGLANYLVRRAMADFAIRHRLPSMVGNRTIGTGGALMSYGPDLAENYRKAAKYVARILDGAKPADLPIEQPTKVELIINLQTAKALGLEIAKTLLLRADEVIQ